MTANIYIDTLTIQIVNIEDNKEVLLDFYKSNNLILLKLDSEHSSHRLCYQNNLHTTIAITHHNGGDFYHPTTYTSFVFSGLKGYSFVDDKRFNLMMNFIVFLKENHIPFKIKRVDIAYDFHTKKTIKYFFPIRTNKMGLRNSINNPFNYFEDTTLYVENKNVKKPSMRAYIYDKSVKEDLDEKIIRFEISIRKFQNEASEEFESFWSYLNQQIAKYDLYYFNNKANCDKNKRIYRNSDFKVSKTFLKSIFNMKGMKIDLSLNSELYDFFKTIFEINEMAKNKSKKKKQYDKSSIGYLISSLGKKESIQTTPNITTSPKENLSLNVEKRSYLYYINNILIDKSILKNIQYYLNNFALIYIFLINYL